MRPCRSLFRVNGPHRLYLIYKEIRIKTCVMIYFLNYALHKWLSVKEGMFRKKSPIFMGLFLFYTLTADAPSSVSSAARSCSIPLGQVAKYLYIAVGSINRKQSGSFRRRVILRKSPGSPPHGDFLTGCGTFTGSPEEPHKFSMKTVSAPKTGALGEQSAFLPLSSYRRPRGRSPRRLSPSCSPPPSSPDRPQQHDPDGISR